MNTEHGWGAVSDMTKSKWWRKLGWLRAQLTERQLVPWSWIGYFCSSWPSNNTSDGESAYNESSECNFHLSNCIIHDQHNSLFSSLQYLVKGTKIKLTRYWLSRELNTKFHQNSLYRVRNTWAWPSFLWAFVVVTKQEHQSRSCDHAYLLVSVRLISNRTRSIWCVELEAEEEMQICLRGRLETHISTRTRKQCHTVLEII
jgi:hypothetical protein